MRYPVRYSARYLTGLALLLFIFPAAAHAALVNINTADAALLDTLPGIGPAKAQAIIDYRTKNGPFAAIEDIQNVSGIGPATYANLKAEITVTASGAPAPSPKPPAQTAGYEKVQKVETITSTQTNAQVHDDDVRAPAAPTDVAAAGAAFSPPPSRGESLLHSPWTLGLLGVIVLAAGGLFVLI